MKTGVIVQARSSSTRLPRKVLLDLPYNSGITVLEQVIRRIKAASKVNSIVIATTTDPEDQEIVAVAGKEGVPFFRGSKENVLERYYLAAAENKLDQVVRITSDCPCIDPVLIDECISLHLDHDADYTSTSLDARYPLGLNVEIMKFSALEKAYQLAKEDFEREHVSIFIYRSRPDLFRIHKVQIPEHYKDQNIRVTLDTPEDYTLLCAVFDYLYNQNELFGVKEIFELYKGKHWLKNINNTILQKKVFNNLKEEMEEAVRLLRLQDLHRVSDFIQEHMEKY